MAVDEAARVSVVEPNHDRAPVAVLIWLPVAANVRPCDYHLNLANVVLAEVSVHVMRVSCPRSSSPTVSNVQPRPSTVCADTPTAPQQHAVPPRSQHRSRTANLRALAATRWCCMVHTETGPPGMRQELDYKELARNRDALAPDGSEIRLLSETSRGSMVHCSLGPGEVSTPVAHRTVEEVWYFLEGMGQVWRKRGSEVRVVECRLGPAKTRRSQ